MWFFEQFTLEIWTGKNRCVCWCWFSLTYFYPRRYLTQWKLQRDCDQDPCGMPEDKANVRRHETHRNMWANGAASTCQEESICPTEKKDKDRQAYRPTRTHNIHTFLRCPLHFVSFDTKGFLCQIYITLHAPNVRILYNKNFCSFAGSYNLHWTLNCMKGEMKHSCYIIITIYYIHKSIIV